MRHQRIEGAREDRYQTVGEHEKVLVRMGNDEFRCFNCGTTFQNDSMGRDMAKTTECNY